MPRKSKKTDTVEEVRIEKLSDTTIRIVTSKTNIEFKVREFVEVLRNLGYYISYVE